ncbi:hypothetical protein AK830_g921 [Neonectria ditissima]|uniref:Uncharacterized protein n=1 Tax=Neonectria ditissima TaxID=78410 RepID=A0A0P7BV63_9HYPO|nr:hypothetical protein AK830_g921 [Neonectria ditissima]
MSWFQLLTGFSPWPKPTPISSPPSASVSSGSPDLDIAASFTFKIDENAFLAQRASQQLSILGSATTGPCAVIWHREKPTITADWLRETVNRWQHADDVFQLGFLETVIFVREEHAPEPVFETSSRELLNEKWKSQVAFAVVESEEILEGPYYIHDGGLHIVWRLFSDNHEAFMAATLPQNEPSGAYQSLPYSDGRRLVIGTPSRLYSTVTETKPLNGLRITVKDNIDLDGTKKTMSSRSWEELYPASNSTAAALQSLLDLGAIVVGKTKLSQFAEVEVPTADWVDFHCPFNPRGDGYLNPEGSTAGGAVALAAYDFVDVSIGTDTGGSLREPCSKQGLFGLRPSWGALSMDGIFPLAVALDTVGFMCRDVDVLHKVASAWLPKTSVPAIQNLSKVVVLSDFEYGPGPAKSVFDDFVSRLEETIQIKSTRMNLNYDWQRVNSTGKNESIIEYIGKQQTMKAIKAFDLRKNTKQFREDYQKAFGKEPYVNPTIRVRWAEADNSTAHEQKDALDRKRIFKDWFLDSILSVKAPDELTAVTLVPISDAEPEYRDDYPEGPWMGGSGFHQNFLSSLTGCPEVVIPIGQIPYQSRVTKRTEFLPVVVAMLGPPGTDVALTKFAADLLHKAGLPTSVKTGRVAFPLD